MQSVSMTELRKDLNAIVDRVSKGEVIRITKYGKPIMYMLPPELYMLMEDAAPGGPLT